jgi:hypothetical protein
VDGGGGCCGQQGDHGGYACLVLIGLCGCLGQVPGVAFGLIGQRRRDGPVSVATFAAVRS